VFTWQTLVEAFVKHSEGEVWETAFGYIPVWPSRFILPAAGFLMTIYIVLDMFLPSNRDETSADKPPVPEA
jgi:hypothetical protein